jgi:hypothetical protein
VVRGLGLDRHPAGKLRDAYFAHYRRVLGPAERDRVANRAAAEVPPRGWGCRSRCAP